MSSRSQHERVTLYLDRNLGSKIVPSVLKREEIPFEIHDDHLDQNAPDEDWIELCARNGWVALTQDTKLKHNPLALAAIQISTAAIFTIRFRRVTGTLMGELIAEFYIDICRFCGKTMRPFLATISRSGHIARIKLP